MLGLREFANKEKDREYRKNLSVYTYQISFGHQISR